MTDDNTRRLTRRTALHGIAGAGGAAILGAGATLALSGGASAAGNSEYNTVELSSNDGTIEYIAIYGDSTVAWDGFDTPAESVALHIEADVTSEWDDQTTDPVTLHDSGDIPLSEESEWGNDETITLRDGGREGEIYSAIGMTEGSHDETTDWHVVGTDPDEYGLPEESIDADALTQGHDGETRAFTVAVRSTYTWYDGDDEEIFAETFTANVPVAITNEPQGASASGGDGGAVGSTGETETPVAE